MSELVSKKYKKVHTTSAIVQILDLTRAGSSIELEMFSKGEKLGTLNIGRAHLYGIRSTQKRTMFG